jgi:FtsZ-interacting cell division protein YlmF
MGELVTRGDGVALQDRMKKFMAYVGLTEEDYRDSLPMSDRNYQLDSYSQQFAEPVAPSVPAYGNYGSPNLRPSTSANPYDTPATSASGRPLVRNISQTASVRPLINIVTSDELEIFLPQNYNETRRIYDILKTRRSVVLNLEHLDDDLFRRVLDFTSGVVYATQGAIKRVAPGRGVFVVSPANVRVSPDAIERARAKNFLP